MEPHNFSSHAKFILWEEPYVHINVLCTAAAKNVDRRYSITVSVLQTKSRSAEESLINTLLWEQNLQSGFFEKRFRHMLTPLLSALRHKASDVSRKLIYRVGKP